MSAQRVSKISLAQRSALTFVIIFVVVFAVGTLFWFLGFGSYAPSVSGAVAGAASVLLNLALNRSRQRQDSKP
jgi:Na+/H+ antiporter NhaC